MTEQRRPPSHDCPPEPADPAPQPHPPGDGKGCDPIPPTTPPPWEKPEPCPPDPDCKCPPGPSSDPNCLELLITAKAAEVAAADKAKAFKADLEALLGKARTASQEYTRDKHEKLVKQWVEQDAAIAELIRKLVCAVPCWRCIIECYICPLLNRMHEADQRLAWDPAKYTKAYNWYDLLTWHTRDKEAKERRFNRIKAVLAKWETPAQTIEKALADNGKLLADLCKSVGCDAPKAVFDVFLKLVPLHLAIAPPSGSKWTTKIDIEYTEFCKCDTGTPDDCCGPDVGVLSFRQQLVGPQPYLIDPNDYIALICCLVDKRYGPAQLALAEADSKLMTIESEIKRDKGLIENGLKTFDKDAKGAIPSVVDCCEFEKKPESEQTQAR